MYYFYLFKCGDNTLYCGSTDNLAKRETLHNTGKGAKYTRGRGQGVMVYSETFTTRGQALRREAEVKRWPRAKKLSLVHKKGA